MPVDIQRHLRARVAKIGRDIVCRDASFQHSRRTGMAQRVESRIRNLHPLKESGGGVRELVNRDSISQGRCKDPIPFPWAEGTQALFCLNLLPSFEQRKELRRDGDGAHAGSVFRGANVI